MSDIVYDQSLRSLHFAGPFDLSDYLLKGPANFAELPVLMSDNIRGKHSVAINGACPHCAATCLLQVESNY
jgi:hypothetical protein